MVLGLVTINYNAMAFVRLFDISGGMYYRSLYCLEVIEGCQPTKVSSLSLITKTLSLKIQSSI